ncbi:MAG: LacI family transcriptional regulator [Clostridia bacterium]|nr:LacI family transcriptional regulator [Clostridia bacterium]
MKTSIRDISKATGFSPATVSNALNHKKSVSRQTAEIIMRKAKELGYFKDSSITKIKLVIYRETGSIIDNTPFFPALISHFERETRENGFETILFNLDRRSPDYEEELDILLNEEDCGLVLLATEMRPKDIDRFREAATPLVILDNWTHDMQFNSVAINNIDSAYVAGDYLIDQGHEQIGYIKSSFRIHNFQARHQGLERALLRRGLSLRKNHIITVAPNIEGAYEDTLRYLGKHGGDLPTAFFADNDLMALGAMRAFQDHGLRIPDDISLIGFDDLPFSALSSPPLTTVFVPNGELGGLVVRNIVRVIKTGTDITSKVEVSTEFVVRGTVRCLSGSPGHADRKGPA